MPKQEHVTPLLKDLHWLPIQQRIDFIILLLTYRALNDLAPKYLTELVTFYCPEKDLRSAYQLQLKVLKKRLKTYGDRSFQYAAAHEWNKLPIYIKQSPSLESFKSNVKTHLFQLSYP